MTDRDLMEMILEALDETKALEDKLIYLFNRVYAEHLKKLKERKQINNAEESPKEMRRL